MFARIEIAVRPDMADSAALNLLRRIELIDPQVRRQIRWARYLEVYWLDIPVSREELITALSEICWDRVLQWVFTGNLMPAAAGKTGGLQDLMELAPYRPGKFCGIERRFRAGVTDCKGNSLLEAIEIVLGKKLPQSRASSGGLLVLEGPSLNEDTQARVAREILCNEMLETWTLVPEEGLKKNERFHQERVKYDLPKMQTRGSISVEVLALKNMSDVELQSLSRARYLDLSVEEMKAIQTYFGQSAVLEKRALLGLSDPTDVEIEIIAQAWSEQSKHKIFDAMVHHDGTVINGLFKTYIEGTTEQVRKPWLLSAFRDNAGICVFDEDDAFCVNVETHHSTAGLEPFGAALTGVLAANRDILGCGLGAKPIFNTNVNCLASPELKEAPSERGLHPRRILDGITRGVAAGSNQSGVPFLNGATVVDDRYLSDPLIFCGSGGLMPRLSAGEPCEVKKVLPGDRICIVGGLSGKDGVHSAAFSALGLSDQASATSVQLGDPMTQNRMSDFIQEARELGLFRAITVHGAGGLSSGVSELALLSGGAQIDLSFVKTKYPGIKPFELMVSESQERMILAVPPLQLTGFLALAGRRGVNVSDIGEFNSSGNLDVFNGPTQLASLSFKFLHESLSPLSLQSYWSAPPDTQAGVLLEKNADRNFDSFKKFGNSVLLGLMARPNIASKESLIRKCDYEAQGTSVIKPLHLSAPGTARSSSGPNDAGVIAPKASSELGLAVGCGIQPNRSDLDPFLMAQAAVDEAVRNVLCVGGEYGTPESVLALLGNFCWVDPAHHAESLGGLVRACQGLSEAALALSVPLISKKDSLKINALSKSTPPALLVTAVARVTDVKQSRTADFKAVGDLIYLLGQSEFGILGSELNGMLRENSHLHLSTGELRMGRPSWSLARKIYSWLGGAQGKQQFRLKSLHDVSEGGLLVAVAESMISRGLGATLWIPSGRDPWEFSAGEGFHAFVGSVSPEEAPPLEAEWDELGVPFQRIGTVESHERMEIYLRGLSSTTSVSPTGNLAFTVTVPQLRAAWSKDGYWE